MPVAVAGTAVADYADYIPAHGVGMDDRCHRQCYPIRP